MLTDPKPEHKQHEPLPLPVWWTPGHREYTPRLFITADSGLIAGPHKGSQTLNFLRWHESDKFGGHPSGCFNCPSLAVCPGKGGRGGPECRELLKPSGGCWIWFTSDPKHDWIEINADEARAWFGPNPLDRLRQFEEGK